MQVLCNFNRKGMQPSCIAGTSAGAIVGGFCIWKTPEEILEFLNRFTFFIGNILPLKRIN